jgi:hypothetical protein
MKIILETADGLRDSREVPDNIGERYQRMVSVERHTGRYHIRDYQWDGDEKDGTRIYHEVYKPT